jgi:hypothetical protein
LRSTLKFRNYFRSLPWDRAGANFVSKYIYNKIVKRGIPDSPFKNGFITSYISYALQLEEESLRGEKGRLNIKNFFTKKYLINLFFKNCYNFYHYVKITDNSTLELGERNILGLGINLISDRRGLFSYFINKDAWLFSSFIYENHLRYLFLNWLESNRNFLLKNPKEVVIWSNFRGEAYKKYVEGRDRPMNNYKSPPQPSQSPFFLQLDPRFFLTDKKKKKKIRWTRRREKKFLFIACRKRAKLYKKKKKRFNLAGLKIYNYEKKVPLSESRNFFGNFKYQDSAERHPLFYANYRAPSVQIDGTFLYAEHFLKRERFRNINRIIPFIPGDTEFSFLNNKVFLKLRRSISYNDVDVDDDILDIGRWKKENVWSYIFYRKVLWFYWRFLRKWQIYAREKLYFRESKKRVKVESPWQIPFKPWKIVDKNWYLKVWNDAWKGVVETGDPAERSIREKNVKKLRNFLPSIKRKIRLKLFTIKKFFFAIWKIFLIYIYKRIRKFFYYKRFITLRLSRSKIKIYANYLKWYFKYYIPYYLFHVSPIFGYIYYKMSIILLFSNYIVRTGITTALSYAKREIIYSFKKKAFRTKIQKVALDILKKSVIFYYKNSLLLKKFEIVNIFERGLFNFKRWRKIKKVNFLLRFFIKARIPSDTYEEYMVASKQYEKYWNAPLYARKKKHHKIVFKNANNNFKN